MNSAPRIWLSVDYIDDEPLRERARARNTLPARRDGGSRRVQSATYEYAKQIAQRHRPLLHTHTCSHREASEIE